jgi:hypothetical protein
MFLPNIKNNEIKLFLSRETRNGSIESQVANRISAEIPIRLDFNRNGDERVFGGRAFLGPRNAAAPFNAAESCETPFDGFRRGFCGNVRRTEPLNPNVCTPFGCKNYVAPPDVSFLEFIDDETHISPRCRADS